MNERAVLTLLLLATACGANPPATDVRLGETTLVLVLNPAVNEGTERAIPPPGEDREAGVMLDDGLAGDTDEDGIEVLAPASAGERTIRVETSRGEGSMPMSLRERGLHEVALAADGARVEVMSRGELAFGAEVVELTQEMSASEVNAALARSNIVVLLRGGAYEGDLTFAGSNVTLFGEGEEGGAVTLRGSVRIEGSDNWIRGAIIDGDLTVSGSRASVSFCRVLGNVEVTGSGATLLANDLCGQNALAGSGLAALGNAGVAPLDSCP